MLNLNSVDVLKFGRHVVWKCVAWNGRHQPARHAVSKVCCMEMVDKPWGGYITFAKNEKVTVKILRIDKGEETSLQSHRNRDEEWFILKGKVRVQFGHYADRLNLKILQRGETTQMPRGSLHRVTGIDDSAILEISRGEFDEEDIIRYEDKYGRVDK